MSNNNLGERITGKRKRLVLSLSFFFITQSVGGLNKRSSCDMQLSAVTNINDFTSGFLPYGISLTNERVQKGGRAALST